MKLIIAVRATPRPPRRTGSLHKKLRKRLRAQAREQAIQNRQRLDQRSWIQSQIQSRIQSQAQQAARLAQAVMENQARQLQTQAPNLVHQPNAARLLPASLAHQLSAEIPTRILLVEIPLVPQQAQIPRYLAQNHHPLQAKVLLAMRRDPRLQTNNIWLPKPCIHHALAAAKATCAARKSDRADNAARNHAHHYTTHSHNHHHNHTPHPQTISQIDSSNATQIY